jgi:hypothetical protein
LFVPGGVESSKRAKDLRQKNLLSYEEMGKKATKSPLSRCMILPNAPFRKSTIAREWIRKVFAIPGNGITVVYVVFGKFECMTDCSVRYVVALFCRS